jgi:hypothetical protein
MRQQDAMNRKVEKERLVLRLEKLASYCKPQDTVWPGTIWPDREFLQSLENNVMLLIATERKNQPALAWRAFQLLNRRMPSLLLVSRVNNLVKRARQRLEEAGESALSKLERQDCEDARKLLGDIEHLRRDLRNAKAIDWAQHEKALAQFSRTRSVEPSYGRSAPLGFRCYARALELIIDDDRRKPLRDKSRQLIEWTARIGHPEAKSLTAFDDVEAWVVEQEEGVWRGKSALGRREKGRDRVRSHREWKKGKWVYPGDWLRFKNATDFARFYGREHPLPKVCTGLEDSPCRTGLAAVLDRLSCGRALADEPYWYYHRTRHVARCPDCQNAEWLEDGYEIEYGYPTTWPGSGDTREERIAAQKRHYQEDMERGQRWLRTPKGQHWLREAEARLKAIESQNRP